jgi:hypothetical protein
MHAHPPGDARGMDEHGAPARYQIRVRGTLSDTLLGAYPALEATAWGNETLLAGTLLDQAAPCGVLPQREALGLVLLEVRRDRAATAAHGPAPAAVRPETGAAGQSHRADRALPILHGVRAYRAAKSTGSDDDRSSRGAGRCMWFRAGPAGAGLGSGPTPAAARGLGRFERRKETSAMSQHNVNKEQHDVKEARRDLQDARQDGGHHDVREERRDLRDEKQDLREARHDRREDRREDRRD